MLEALKLSTALKGVKERMPICVILGTMRFNLTPNSKATA